MGSESSKSTPESSGQMIAAARSESSDGGEDAAPENGEEEERAQEYTGARQAIILVIDDDLTIRNFLHNALRLRGYHVTAVGTVREAEEVLQQLGAAALGLVIADIQLTTNRQAREGYVLYQRWTAQYPALPFLLISGDPGSQSLPAIHTGAVHFLPKPFTIGELLDMVRLLFLP